MENDNTNLTPVKRNVLDDEELEELVLTSIKAHLTGGQKAWTLEWHKLMELCAMMNLK